MSKVHITLVGGQNMPVYLGIKYANPDMVIFICSQSSKKNIAPLKAMFPDIKSQSLLTDPSDMDNIKARAQQCFEQCKDDEVSINISSGTKSWAYFFTIWFATHKNAKTFYIDQNSVIYDFLNGSSQQLGFSISEQMMLTNSQISSHIPFSDYSDDDFQSIDLIRSFRDSYRLFTTFKSLTEEMEQHSDLTMVEQQGSSLNWIKAEKKFILTVKRNGIYTFSSPHARHLVLNAGWFEVWVAKMLSEWDKCKELWTNCVFQMEAIPSNEIDIIANLGNKLLFVECKTQLMRPTDIDKFNSVVKKYGGNGSKALFITYEHMDKSIRETCDRYGIIPFSFKSKDPSKVKASSSLVEVLTDNVLKNNI